MAKDLNGVTLRFGDIICNGWAGNRNPHKIVMFIKATKRYFNFVALDGEQGQTYRDDHKITKVGEVGIAEWAAMAERQKSIPD